MHKAIMSSLHKLSHKSAMVRKQAIKELKLHVPHNPMARISLHYVSVHDSNYTIRNLAKRACFGYESCATEDPSWEKTYSF